MPYKFLEDVAIADIAFSARAGTLGKLFSECAMALEECMVDRDTLRQKKQKTIKISAGNPDKLLFDFLSELVFIKDSKRMLFKKFSCKVSEKGDDYLLHAKCFGEKIVPKRMLLRNDVKAVTRHMFKIQKAKRGWKALVVLDI